MMTRHAHRSRLLPRGLSALAIACLTALLFAGCGEASPPTSPTSPSTAPSESPGASGESDASASRDGVTCDSDAGFAHGSGASIPRPAGKVLRFTFAYQGGAIGVQDLRGVDMVIAASDGPFHVEKNSGWWTELRSATGATLYTRLVRDPTSMEAPAGGGGFTRTDVDPCTASLFTADVLNDPAAREVVVFGSVASNRGGATRELARFTLE